MLAASTASAEILATAISMRLVFKLLFGSGERLVSLLHSQEPRDHVLVPYRASQTQEAWGSELCGSMAFAHEAPCVSVTMTSHNGARSQACT